MSDQSIVPFDFDWDFYQYLFASIGIPTIALLINFKVRGWKNSYLTGGADFALMEGTFCLASLVLFKDASQYIRRPDFRDHVVFIFVVLSMLTWCLWAFIVSEVEVAPHLLKGKTKWQWTWTHLKLLFAWAVSIGLFSALVGVFLAKPKR
jgi:hypothetical protein